MTIDTILDTILAPLDNFRRRRREKQRAERYAKRREARRRRHADEPEVFALSYEQARPFLSEEVRTIMDRDGNNDGNGGDEVKTCVDCNGTWILRAGERQFYDSRGLSQPRRCSACRAFRRQEREAGQSAA